MVMQQQVLMLLQAFTLIHLPARMRLICYLQQW